MRGGTRRQHRRGRRDVEDRVARRRRRSEVQETKTGECAWKGPRAHPPTTAGAALSTSALRGREREKTGLVGGGGVENGRRAHPRRLPAPGPMGGALSSGRRVAFPAQPRGRARCAPRANEAQTCRRRGVTAPHGGGVAPTPLLPFCPRPVPGVLLEGSTPCVAEPPGRGRRGGWCGCGGCGVGCALGEPAPCHPHFPCGPTSRGGHDPKGSAPRASRDGAAGHTVVGPSAAGTGSVSPRPRNHADRILPGCCTRTVAVGA